MVRQHHAEIDINPAIRFMSLRDESFFGRFYPSSLASAHADMGNKWVIFIGNDSLCSFTIYDDRSPETLILQTIRHIPERQEKAFFLFAL